MIRRAIAVVLVLAGSACKSDESPRWLVIDERVDLCAAAASAPTPLDQVRATQWRLGIDVGEYEVLESQPFENRDSFWSPDGAPMPAFLDVRDVDAATPFEAAPEGVVLEHANLSFTSDETRDVLSVWSSLDVLMGESGSWRLSLTIEAETGDDFHIDGPRDAHFACVGDLIGLCPNRSFDACDPGGPTVRTRVTLDRGEVVLHVRWIERDPINGDPHRRMFVAGEVHLDDVAVVQSDFFQLLHSADYSVIGDGSYAVLAPESLEPAGLGCGIAVTDIGTEQPRAYTVDCAMQELEPLAILDIARETLP